MTETVETIQLYTLEDAEKVINKKKQEILRSKIKDVVYYLKQKLCGAGMVGIGVLFPIIADGDATISLFLVPVGIFLLATKERAIYIK